MKRVKLYAFMFLAFSLSLVGCKKDSEKDKTSVNNDTPVETVTNGILPGLFSVAEGRQVQFSQGNLQYQASTNTWRFASQQYEYVGEDNENIGANYDGWIDHFCWGTSGWQGSGAAGYQPYSFRINVEDYYVGGSYDNDLIGDYANADWGVYNAISNGGNEAGLWRTMTAAEWKYLFDQRPRAASLRGFATVCGYYGILLLPDDWNNTEISFNPSGIYSTNTYSVEVWNRMQEQGAVFLPAAGYRTVKTPGMMGMNGLYWSVNANSSESDEYVYALVFNVGTTDRNGIGGMFPNGESQRFLGCSVRLVRDAE